MSLEVYTAAAVTIQLVLGLIATWQRQQTTREAVRRRRKRAKRKAQRQQ